MALPLTVRAIRLSFDSVDRGLEDAAGTLGAGRCRVFFTITLPLISPGLITGSILAFARSLGEFGATITFVSNIPGQTRNHPHRHLQSDPDSGRRRPGHGPLWDQHHHRPGFAGFFRIPGTQERQAIERRGMIKVEVQKKLGQLNISGRFELINGRILALFGPSGAGKTSLINMVAGLLKPDRGLIQSNSQILYSSEKKINLTPPKRRIGYIFQDSRLFPHLSVRQNLTYGFKLVAPENRYIEFDKVIGVLGIEHLLQKGPPSPVRRRKTKGGHWPGPLDQPPPAVNG